MKTETARKFLVRRGWVDIPTQAEAARMLAFMAGTSWVCQDGTYVTQREREALRAIAAAADRTLRTGEWKCDRCGRVYTETQGYAEVRGKYWCETCTREAGVTLAVAT